MKGFEGLLTSFESKDAQTLRKTEREQCEGAFCPTRFKDFKHIGGDGRRIIRGWPTSPESLYDAFSKTSGKSCAHLQHSTHFWHLIVGERVFFIFYLRQCGSRYFPPCCLTAGTWEHLKSLQESHSHLSKDSLSLSLCWSLRFKFNRSAPSLT